MEPVRRYAQLLRSAAAIATLVALVGAAACGSDGSDDSADAGRGQNRGPGDPVQVDDEGVTRIPGADLEGRVDSLPTADLTQAEIDGLIWMREEEKLALDVYTALGDIWSVRVFDNIAAAEQTHTDAVLTLLDRYGIADPSTGTPGVFTEPAIGDLHDSLVAQGRESEVAALTVGAEIEELDIVDLRERATDTPDIDLVYANLEKGSRNHLRAFVSQLERNGVTYTPTHLSQSDFDAIVTSDIERGSTD